MNDIEKNVIEGTAEAIRRLASANQHIVAGERDDAVHSLRTALFYVGETLGPLLGVDFLGLEFVDVKLDRIVERLIASGCKHREVAL